MEELISRILLTYSPTYLNTEMASQAPKRVIVVIGRLVYFRFAEPYLRSCRLGKRIWNGWGNCVSNLAFGDLILASQ